jgi:pyruvate/2-oxoglutarate dehydrogenase complex dihydrolipoamide acyltransferase (E2) component
MTQVSIPKLGMQMMEADIIEWHVGDGAFCKAGADLVTIETDKVAHTVTADVDGYLTIAEPTGATCPVGHVIGRLDESPGGGGS